MLEWVEKVEWNWQISNKQPVESHSKLYYINVTCVSYNTGKEGWICDENFIMCLMWMINNR